MKRPEYLAVVVATLAAIATALGVSMSGGEDLGTEWHVARGALDGDCANSGVNPDGGIQFIAICPQASMSPDGRWRLVQTPPVGADETYDVFIETPNGKRVGRVPGLNDHMPFVLYWSPRSGWFMANHWQGSGLQLPRVFQITGDRVVEHMGFLRTGENKAREISPCLPAPKRRLWVTGDGLRWSKDGRRLAWRFYTRPDTCLRDEADIYRDIPAEDQWRPFLMISDVTTGEIIDGSIRILPDGGKWSFPVDGPYRDF
ncbi:hypothetical protein [Sphingopyxis sp.]|uniref:hypothetical protein n=1 Tax=Sphingopyxis sp. TaxID=1908224 RepID=UPI00260D3172|nr:hypothetical protein [Sphingopyxis sp.]MCW0197032.1 hypothetical protein [Sphingopyxis sp.]